MAKLKGKARQRASKKARNRAVSKRFLVNKSLREDIRKWDDPILTKSCYAVSLEEDVSYIIRTLKATLRATKNGVGLAAPQVGYIRRVIAIRPNRISNEVKILINPEIKEFSEATEWDREGCLSYPEIFVNVERAKEVQVEYLNEKMELQSQKFTGSEARIIQHECDHLSGVCIVGKAWKERIHRESGEVISEGLSATDYIKEPDKNVIHPQDATSGQDIRIVYPKEDQTDPTK